MRSSGFKLPPKLSPYAVTLAMLGGSFTQNTAGNLTTAATQNADGSITMSLVGGKQVASATIPDPDDAAAVWSTWGLVDANGDPITGDAAFSMRIELDFPTGAPALADDVSVFFGIVNDVTPIGTPTGVLYTAQYLSTNANPRARAHTLIAGTVGNEINGGTSASLTGQAGTFLREAGASGGTKLLWGLGSTGLSSVLERISGAGTDSVNGTGNGIGTSQNRVIMGAYRLRSGNAATVAIKPRVRVFPTVFRTV